MNAMSWDDRVPIFKQLKDKVIALILDAQVAEGEAVPSVRQVAAEYQINPLTVSKAYQELVDEDILEKKRGLGMFVKEGAKQRLLEQEKARFLNEEWPQILIRLKRLGLDLEQLPRAYQKEERQS